MNRCVVITLFVSLSLSAQADETIELKQVTVTARPAGFQSLEHIAQPVSILQGDELEKKQSNSIGETLSGELGVSASDFGQGASRPIIRGLGGQRLQVLQGGIGTMDVSTISVDHNISLSPMNAEQIEILRGPATLLYGNGASAGVVNLVTNRIPESLPEFNTDLNIRHYSAFRGQSLALKAEGSVDDFAMHFDVSKLDTNNYKAKVGEIFNSEINTDDINLGGSYIADWGFFGISFGRYTSIYEIPLNSEEPDEQVSINLEQNRYDFAAQLNDPMPGLQHLRLKTAHNDYSHIEFENPVTAGTRFFNNEWEGRLEASHNTIGPWQGVLGLHFRNRSFAAVGDEAFVPPAKLNSLAVFLFEDTDWDNWHFEIGARYEYQQIEPTTTTGLTDIDHQTYTLSLGAVVGLTDNIDFGINIGRSQRAPALEELLASGPHLATETFEVGNPNLTEETANSIDLSLGMEGIRWSWKVNLFSNYIEDFIFQQFQDVNGDGLADEVDEAGVLGAGELQSVRYQQDDAIFYGLELETTLQIFTGSHGDLKARLFGDMVRAKLDGGEDLPRIAPARIGLGLDYRLGSWGADLDMINVFEQNDTAALETGTGGYVMVNAGISYDLKAGSTDSRLFMRGSNLLDEDARRHTSFIKDRAPLPGRSALVGIRLQY